MINSTPFSYQFPKFARVVNAYDQIRHMQSEANEVREANDLYSAAVMAHVGEATEQSALQALAVEAMDYLHSGETLLHILEEAGADLEAAKRDAIAKNDARGYYDGLEGSGADEV